MHTDVEDMAYASWAELSTLMPVTRVLTVRPDRQVPRAILFFRSVQMVVKNVFPKVFQLESVDVALAMGADTPKTLVVNSSLRIHGRASGPEAPYHKLWGRARGGRNLGRSRRYCNTDLLDEVGSCEDSHVLG